MTCELNCTKGRMDFGGLGQTGSTPCVAEADHWVFSLGMWNCGALWWVLLSGALAESLALSLSFCDIEFIEFDMLSNFNSWWEWQWMIVSLSFKNSCERSSSLGCYLIRSSRFVTLIVVKPLEHYLLGKDNHHLFWSVIYYLKSIVIEEREKNK